jgi:hypothetical protein
MGLNTVLECGKEQKVIHILENGNLEKLMVMELIHGLMVIDMKANLSNALNKVKVYKSFQMGIYIKVCIIKVNHLVMDNIIGPIKHILKEILKMDLEMVKVYGKRDLEQVINIKATMLMIKNKDMAFLLGLVEMFIKEII